MARTVGIGKQNFGQIIEKNCFYVDKTGFIKEWWEAGDCVTLIARPRRFGKTLNMDMLRCFFQIGGDRALFDGLDIAEEKGLCERYMGKFPVISISLKGVSGLDYQTARALMCLTIGREAMKFYDLLESKRLTDADKKIYRQLIQVDSTGQSVYAMSDITLMGSLHTLSELLEKHYGSRVIILIDEYDVPLAKANEQGYYDQMIVLIRNMFEQALKTNSSLQFAVLTGCLRVSKESIFTGLNNLLVFSITDPECDSYFGFKDDEVKEMLEYYEINEKYDLIKEWYDGYCFGDTDVYCPWDVISYVNKLLVKRNWQPQNYWANTSSNEVLKRLLKEATSGTRDEIERLIAGEPVWKQINEELTYKELYDSIENVWSVLFVTGYLTQQGEADGKMRRLVIPNREIHDIFMTQIRTWMQEKAREDRERLRAFCEAFREADGEAVQRIFTEYLSETVSVRDTAVRKELKENFYHGFLLGLLRFKEDWKVLSNREGGQGYADIVIEIFAEKTGIVIEVKYAENGDLEAGCREALEQIERKGYIGWPGLAGMGRVIKCGMACHIKNCKAVFVEGR